MVALFHCECARLWVRSLAMSQQNEIASKLPCITTCTKRAMLATSLTFMVMDYMEKEVVESVCFTIDPKLVQTKAGVDVY